MRNTSATDSAPPYSSSRQISEPARRSRTAPARRSRATAPSPRVTAAKDSSAEASRALQAPLNGAAPLPCAEAAQAAELARGAPPAPRQLTERALILSLGLLAAFGPLAIDMYLPAFPTIAKDLGTTTGIVGWTLAIYFVGLSVGQLLIGPITDRVGRARPLRYGLLVFAVGSLGAALAPSVELLILARAVQSLGGAACAVTSRSVVRDLYRGAEASRINSRLVLIMGIAPIVAPLLGGALLSIAGWRAIFVSLTAVAALTYLAVAARFPETAPVSKGAAATSPSSLLRSLLADRDFLAFAFIAALSSAAMFAYITAAPLVFIQHHHVAPAHFGWFFGANAAGYIVASQLNARFLRTQTSLTLLTRGVGLAVFAAALLTLGAITDWGLWLTAISCCTFLFSLGFIMPNAVALALEHQGRHAGGASAWIGALQFGLAGLSSATVSAGGSVLAMAAAILTLTLLASAVLVASRTRAQSSMSK